MGERNRIRGLVHAVVEGLTPDQLAFRVDGQANSIAWLVWHLTRIQDDHVADAADTEQVWTAGGWAKRFALPWEQRGDADPQAIATDAFPALLESLTDVPSA